MLLLAHRGASADAPENTIEAFREAARQQADGVELDAMVCGSGEVVVCHDEELTRLAGVPWKVGRTPLQKLRSADVGSHLGFAAAGIPTLEEVVEVLPRHFVLNIELKCDTVDDRGLARKVGEYVEQEGLQDRVVISSFNALCLVRLAEAFPSLRRGYLIDPDKSFFLHGGLISPMVSRFSVHPYARDVTPERMERWREAGLKVAVWTLDDVDEAWRLKRLGVDYLITNRPAALRQALVGRKRGQATLGN
jgi:glycerophosphoryl diester phosphodiesterase